MANQQDQSSHIKHIRKCDEALLNNNRSATCTGESAESKPDTLIYTLPCEVLTEITKYSPEDWYLVSRYFSKITKYQMIRYRISKCRIKCENIIEYIRLNPVEDNNRTTEDLEKTCLLFELAANGDISAIQFLVDVDHYDINQKNVFGDSLLHTALEQNQVELAQKLISEYQLDINEQGDDDDTPLHQACYHGHFDITIFALSLGADINLTNCYGFTPLYVALLYNRNDIAKLLVDVYHADVNIKCHSGVTVLHLAASGDFVDIIDSLYTESNNKSSAYGELIAFLEFEVLK